MLEVFIFATLNGLVTGLLMFMLASGLTLIFSMMGVLNFAHASFYMLGAYFAYSISLYFGFWTGLIFAPLIVGVLGALGERYGLRRVHQSGHVAELVFTFGMAVLIEEAVQLFWGPDTKNYQTPDLLDFPLFTLFGQEFPAYRGFMIGISVTIFIGLPFIFMAVFGVGTALAGIAGVIAGPILTTFPGMAVVLGSIVFVIVVIGGLGSLVGAFLAALLIWLFQSYAIASDVGVQDLLNLLGLEFDRNHPLTDLWTLTLPQIAPILPFLMLVLVLNFRPTGLMGKREQ